MMTVEEATKARALMCFKCSNATYVPGPGDLPHCGFSCESTCGYEDILEQHDLLRKKFEGADL